MNSHEQLNLMAYYNLTMNQRIYAACAQLSSQQLYADQGAFFGSLFGTLNHIAVADTIWLKRFAQQFLQYPFAAVVNTWPWPAGLDAPLDTDFTGLTQRRQLLDVTINQVCNQLTAEDLLSRFSYTTLRGDVFTKNLMGVLLHFFNHQTHHRGQATALLSQLGVDYGSTDLVSILPNI